MNDVLYSTMVRSGRTTYFVDVKSAKNGNKYIAITEHRLESDDKRTRSSIRVFADSVPHLTQAVQEAAVAVK